MKHTVTLVFPSLFQLWAFAQSIRATSMMINTSHKSLICDCRAMDIELAEEKYSARLLAPVSGY